MLDDGDKNETNQADSPLFISAADRRASLRATACQTNRRRHPFSGDDIYIPPAIARLASVAIGRRRIPDVGAGGGGQRLAGHRAIRRGDRRKNDSGFGPEPDASGRLVSARYRGV